MFEEKDLEEKDLEKAGNCNWNLDWPAVRPEPPPWGHWRWRCRGWCPPCCCRSRWRSAASGAGTRTARSAATPPCWPPCTSSASAPTAGERERPGGEGKVYRPLQNVHPGFTPRSGLMHLYISFGTPPRWPSGKASASRAEDPGFESRLRRDFFGVESYQWLKNWHSSGYPARRLAL